MATSKKTIRICSKGHKFTKSSDCPVCPICEKVHVPKADFLAQISAPARRALEREGITSLLLLSKRSEKGILALHGIGPGSIPRLKMALATEGLAFRKD